MHVDPSHRQSLNGFEGTEASAQPDGKALEVTKPPKGMKNASENSFGENLKGELGWIPSMVGSTFVNTANLYKSTKDAAEKPRTKDARLDAIQQDLDTMRQDRKEKLHDMRVEIRSLPEEVRNTAKTYYIREKDSGKPLPSVLFNLRKTDDQASDAMSNLKQMRGELNSISKKINDLTNEKTALEKVTTGTVVSKAVRTALVGTAAPFVTALMSTAVAPVLPIWGVLGTMNAASITVTGKTLTGGQRDMSAIRNMAAQANDGL